MRHGRSGDRRDRDGRGGLGVRRVRRMQQREQRQRRRPRRRRVQAEEQQRVELQEAVSGVRQAKLSQILDVSVVPECVFLRINQCLYVIVPELSWVSCFNKCAFIRTRQLRKGLLL